MIYTIINKGYLTGAKIINIKTNGMAKISKKPAITLYDEWVFKLGFKMEQKPNLHFLRIFKN